MELSIKQRNAIEFLVKNHENGADIFRKLKNTYFDNCMSRSQVFEWIKRFKNGRESAYDDPRLRRPVTAQTKDVSSKVREWVRQKDQKFFRNGIYR